MIFFLVAVITLASLCMGGSFVTIRRMKKRPEIDYKKINELEWDLGLGHSDFGAKGLDIAAKAAEVATLTDKVIEDIEDELHPGRRQAREFRRKVASPFSIPSHMMGSPKEGYGYRSNAPSRFDYPGGDHTYDGPHGLSCPCENCYGEIQRRSSMLDGTNTIGNDIVADLRAKTRVGGRPLPPPVPTVPTRKIRS
jgi:hypothetical protein